METLLLILLAITAALAAWNIRLAAQARRERGGLRQSLENLEVRMGEISGTLTGSTQSIAEAKAAQGEREKSELNHRRDVLAAQEKAAVSGKEIQEALGRLGETLSAFQNSQREGAQSAAATLSKKMDGLESQNGEAARSGTAGMEKILAAVESIRSGAAEKDGAIQSGMEKVRQSLAAQIQGIEGAWSQSVESLRAGIAENRSGLAETMAEGREASAKAMQESLENHAGRIRELLDGMRSGSSEARAQTLAEVESVLGRFEKRVADYLEENALKVQEILLEALDRFPEEATATQILARSDEGRETHGG